MSFYKAIKEGFDGKQIRKPGEVFRFAGKRGSWMVPCDESGNVTEAVVKERDTRLGTKVSSNLTREELREECRKLGITFKATAGAVELANLLRKFEEDKSKPAGPASGSSSENTVDNATGVGAGAGAEGGTGDQDVI